METETTTSSIAAEESALPADPTVNLASDSATGSASSKSARREHISLRNLCDIAICLIVAIILFRTFQVEGYMISTGSMAPCLLGFHRQVVCPKCEYEFTIGAAFDDSVEPDVENAGTLPPGSRTTTCPNCNQSGIDISNVPVNQGDQLLVHKTAFLFRAPRRWEIIVFRNPYQPGEAYVKRLIGLPGESVLVKHGDVFVDGKLQRKNWDSQRSARILVHDHDFESSNDTAWRTRWMLERHAASWSADDRGFRFVPGRRQAVAQPISAASPFGQPLDDEVPPISQAPEWVTYRHWIRRGGDHRTVVSLDQPAPDGIRDIVNPPGDVPFTAAVEYDFNSRELSCRGVLGRKTVQKLLELSEEPAFRDAVEQLYERSHWAEITDDYAYNGAHGGRHKAVVFDMMVSLNVKFDALDASTSSMPSDTVAAATNEDVFAYADEPQTKQASAKASPAKRSPPSSGEQAGLFVIEMWHPAGRFQCRLNAARRKVSLFAEGEETALRQADWPADVDEADGVTVEMSLFDHQVAVALDGRQAFPPYVLEPEIPAEVNVIADRERRIRFAATGTPLSVNSLQVYRDVYYTPGRARHGVNSTYTLGEDEYFVLGDNSPVSSDSRSWDEPVVHRRLLVGKPFLVHLPSRPGILKVGGVQKRFRIPDLGRIRFIH